MTNNSQILQNLVKSAKNNQDEFENSLKEIHAQSAKSIGAELTKIYANEMNAIKTNIQADLNEISKQYKKTTLQGLINFTTPMILMLGIVVGFFLNFYIYSKDRLHYQNENQELLKWQIPMNMRDSFQSKTTNKEQRVLVINPKSMKKTESQSGEIYYFYYLNKAEI